MLVASDAEIVESFVVSVVGFLVIVSCHLVAMHGAARLFRRWKPDLHLRTMRFRQTVVVIIAVMTLLFTLHLLTNFAWGLVIWGAGVLPGYRESIFYSLENYTSLGLTRIEVGDRWRMLAPMISLSGVFCLGWSTAMLVGLFGQLYAVVPDE